MKLKFPKEFYKYLINGTVFMCIALILTIIIWVTDSSLDFIFGGVVLVSLFMGYIDLATVIIAYHHLKPDNCDVELEADADATDESTD